ncbi:TPA: hypothetical protein ACHCBX_002867 [Vibrio parahaemolyticus]|uniref:hypothetical protein n=1 Tax=Vibrio parahaemolyticus TaxID=670 RepID=UPI0005B6DDF1|nr:hypothetical protein [Vibrio parahaemolyticus]EGQ7778686.1 hypothetical protein [Vibrio parahaemolyticus]EGQ8397885.1 hypothetical protein [Vibrio parahaemolyticus]EGQ9049437.1 hypothetical protein [Vibrio parahaemolyticus]EGQ9147947.1 hypothetical protein [Vibrio parahaemolyticus]EGQ9589411.1 hypothetical protein [Vibrio parahaemolyticus]
MKSYNVTSHVHSNSNVRNLDIENDPDFGNSVTQVREKHATQASKLSRLVSIFNQKKGAESKVKLTKYENKDFSGPRETDFKSLLDAVFTKSKKKSAGDGLTNWHFGVTPAAFGPTPNEVAVRIVEKISSQYHYCQDGVIGIKHSRLKVGIAINHSDKTIALVFKRKNETGLQNLFKHKNSQQDYLNASVILNRLMSYAQENLGTYQVVIAGQNQDSRLIAYAASKNESANEKLKTVVV